MSLLVLFVVSIGGCSSEMFVRNDLFYPKKHEPRTVMPWFGSVGGQSNRNGVSGNIKGVGFGKLGGDE